MSEQLQSLVTTVNQSIKLNQLNIDAAQQQFLNESTRLSLESLAGNQDNSVQTLILVYIVGFILYMQLCSFLQWLLKTLRWKRVQELWKFYSQQLHQFSI